MLGIILLPSENLPVLQGLRGSIPANFPCFHVEFNLTKGFVHVIDDEAKFSQFGRGIMIGLLDLPAEDIMSSVHDAQVSPCTTAEFQSTLSACNQQDSVCGLTYVNQRHCMMHNALISFSVMQPMLMCAYLLIHANSIHIQLQMSCDLVKARMYHLRSSFSHRIAGL